MSEQSERVTYEKRARVGRLINKTQTELVLALNNALEPFDVTAAQYVILSTLWAGRGDTAAQICKEISYSAGSMTRMLDRLEQKRLIRRLPDAHNRRCNKLQMTDEGNNIFPALLDVSTAVIDHFFGNFNMTELQQLEMLLEKTLAR